MNAQTRRYSPLAIGLAAALGLVCGAVVAGFKFKLSKLMRGG